MTFTEAAVEVLRLVGKPLHYKKITELAIERNLLSHVGKTPEVTMSSRLATMVKRDRGEAPIIKVKPGVFGLREFNEEQLADLSGDIDELPEVEVEEEQEKATHKAAPVAQEAREGASDLVSLVPAAEPRKPLPGADVFPEEEDDDEPILGGDDDEDDDEEADGEEARSDAQPGAEQRGSSRRRRKRRRRGGVDDATPEATEPRAREPREFRRDERSGRDERSAREREPRDVRRDERGRDERARDERGRDDRTARDDRAGRDDRRRDRDRERDDRREREEPLDSSREPGDGDLLGKDLADAVASVLGQSGPRGLPPIRIADQLVRRGRLAGDPHALVPTIMASVRADIARKRVELVRPRFRLEGTAVVLTDFLLPQDVVRAEQEVARAAERQRERTRRAFLRKLGELPAAGLAEIIATWLNAEGIVGLRAVRRPGAGVGELHLAGTLRRGADEIRLAIVVYREARELGRERVIEARGALHYYGNASAAWLVTFGNVMSGAREEASAPAAGPVALYDGVSLAAAMEKQGVGLAVQYVPISALDFELLDALRGQVPRERDLDQERGGRRDRERGERDRDRDRDRNRPSLERPRPQEDERETDSELDEELDEEVALDESDEVIEAALQDPAAQSAESVEAQADARESGRRRRRRRRRKGGRGEGAGDAQAVQTGESAESAEERGEAASWGESEELEGDEDEFEEAREYAPSEGQDEGAGPFRTVEGDEPEEGDEADREPDDERVRSARDRESLFSGHDELNGESEEVDGEASDENSEERERDDESDESSDEGTDSEPRDEGEPEESEGDHAYPNRRGHG